VFTDSHISAEIVSRRVRAPSRAASTQERIETGLSAAVVSRVGPSGPEASKVMPCWTKIASRRSPAARSLTRPSRASVWVSAAAGGRGRPPGSNSSSKNPGAGL
jgi:hypothetical protein